MHREIVNSQLWLTTQFLLAHEVGHVLLGHLDQAAERQATSEILAGAEPIDALRPHQSEEFDADRFGINTLITADGRSELFQAGSDADAGWNSAYLTLGWLFSLVQAIETIAPRLGSPPTDRIHEPATGGLASRPRFGQRGR